jgi:membrane protein EpsK
MGGMGFNSFFNSLGILLYTSSDIIIVNVLLGSVDSGRYGIAVQCGMVITMLGGSITRLLAPVLVELIAKDRRDELINYIVRFTKLITVFSAIPFIVFVVFSKPLLGFWLGDGFESLYLLNILVVSNQLFHQTTSLTFTYFNMKNKLRIPAIMTFITGILNILLSIVLVKYTELGVYGVALGTFISIFLKTIIFNVIYASRLLKMSPLLVWKSVLKGIYWPLGLGGLLFFLFNFATIDSILVLILCIVSLLIIYSLGALYLPLNSEDRTLLFKISKLDKVKWRTSGR